MKWRLQRVNAQNKSSHKRSTLMGTKCDWARPRPIEDFFLHDFLSGTFGNVTEHSPSLFLQRETWKRPRRPFTQHRFESLFYANFSAVPIKSPFGACPIYVHNDIVEKHDIVLCLIRDSDGFKIEYEQPSSDRFKNGLVQVIFETKSV